MHIGVNARPLSVAEPGGEVQSARRLVRALADREGTQVKLFGHQSLASEFPDLRIVSRGFPVNSQSYGLVWEQAVLPSLVTGANVDVLLCPNGNGVVRDPGVPIVTVVHDLFAFSGHASRPYSALQRLRLPVVVRASDRLVSVSEFSRRRLAETFDIDAHEVPVVYNGIDDLFLDDGAGMPIDLPARYILFVGGMNRRKNLATLLASFRILREDAEFDHELVLVGPSDKRIYEDVEDSGLHDQIHHLGFVTAEELKYVYRNASVFAYPSFREGFGIPPLEAMACGTPVVSSDRPAMPEVLGDAPEYAEPTDPAAFAAAIRRVLDDDERRRTVIAAGKERAAQFTWDRAAREMLSELEAACN